MRPNCPIHKSKLLPKQTKYGVRYYCPVDNCTVVCWDGGTSSPANLPTRQKRIEAHRIFDKWWVENRIKRSEAYRRLANFLGLEISKTHIGHFGIEQCGQVIKFVAEQVSY